MLGKLSIYLFLLLIIPDIYIYKLYITRSTGGSPFEIGSSVGCGFSLPCS